MCRESGLSSENQSVDDQTRKSDFGGDMTCKDAEHSLPSCSDSGHTDAEKTDADISDEDNQGDSENNCPLCNELFTTAAEYTVHLKRHTDGNKCLVCNKVLSSPNSLDRHLLVHSKEKPFVCQKCGKSFTTNGNMNRHKRKRKHSSNNSAPAKKSAQAKKSTTDKKNKIDDNNETLNSSSANAVKGRMHTCSHCIFSFTDIMKWDVKMENFHFTSKADCEQRRTCPFNPKGVNKDSKNSSSAAVCDSCGDICLRLGDLHPEKNNAEVFACKSCEAWVTDTKHKLQLHEWKHKHPEDVLRFLTCEICGNWIAPEEYCRHQEEHKISVDNQAMDTDVRNETNKSLYCKALGLYQPPKLTDDITSTKKTVEIKGEDFGEPLQPIPESIPSHDDSCLQQQTFEEAPKVVSLTSQLDRNVTSPISADCASPVSNSGQTPASPVEGSSTQKHFTSDNEFQCKECSQCFKTKKLLKIHCNEFHLQKTPFKCHVCDYVTTDKSTLSRHMRRHTGERPYMCIKCQKKFTTEPNAKRHVNKTHKIIDKYKKYVICNSSEKFTAKTENTKCPYCRKDFGDPKLLSQHKNSPDCPGKHFVCSECSTRFPTKNNCLRHMTQQHKLDKETAKKMMIIDKPDLANVNKGNENENNPQLQKSEQISEVVHNEVATHHDNGNSLKIVVKDENPENSVNITKTNDNNANNGHSEMNAETIADVPPSSCTNEIEDTQTSSINSSVETASEQRWSSCEVDASYSMLTLAEQNPYETLKSFQDTLLQTEQAEPLMLSEEILDQIEQDEPLRLSQEIPYQAEHVEPVSLSQEIPHQMEQAEPLDLSLSPLDLRMKKSQGKRGRAVAEINSRISLQLRVLRSVFRLPPPDFRQPPPKFRLPSPELRIPPANSSIPPRAHVSTYTPGSSLLKQSSQCNLLNSFRAEIGHLSPEPHFASGRLGSFQSGCSRNSSMCAPELEERNFTNSDDSYRKLYIVEDTTSTNLSNDNGVTQANVFKQYSNDIEINDLASVSSVIHTANSQDINKYLKTATFPKSHSSKTELSVLSNASKSNMCKNSGGKKFPCEQCTKGFDTSSALERHMVIHTGVKLHKCSTCEKAFGTKSNCKRHEQTHLPKNIKKPRCPLNESQTASDISNNPDLSNLNGHVMDMDQSGDVPHNSFNYSFDAGHPNPFLSTTATFSHLLSVNFGSAQTFDCNFCISTYKSKKDLTNHIKKLHPLHYLSQEVIKSS